MLRDSREESLPGGFRMLPHASAEAPEMHTDMDYDSFLADDFALGVP